MFFRRSFELIQNDLQESLQDKKKSKLWLYRILGVSKLIFDFGVLHYQYIYMFIMQSIGQDNDLKSNMGDLWTYMVLLWTYLIITAILLLEVHSFHLAFQGDFQNFDSACNFLSFIVGDAIRFITISTYQSFIASPLIESSDNGKDPVCISNIVYDFIILFIFFMRREKRDVIFERHSCEQTECDCQCSICLDETKEALVGRLDCKHEFHKECITEWSKKSKKCPLCNTINVFIEIEEV